MGSSGGVYSSLMPSCLMSSRQVKQASSSSASISSLSMRTVKRPSSMRVKTRSSSTILVSRRASSNTMASPFFRVSSSRLSS